MQVCNSNKLLEYLRLTGAWMTKFLTPIWTRYFFLSSGLYWSLSICRILFHVHWKQSSWVWKCLLVSILVPVFRMYGTLPPSPTVCMGWYLNQKKSSQFSMNSSPWLHKFLSQFYPALIRTTCLRYLPVSSYSKWMFSYQNSLCIPSVPCTRHMSS